MTAFMYYVRRIDLLATFRTHSTHTDSEFMEYAYHELEKDIDKSQEMGNLSYQQHGKLIARLQRECI